MLRKWTENAAFRFWCRCWAVAFVVIAVVKIHFTVYVLTNFIENAKKSDRSFYQHRVRARTKPGLGVQVPVHDYKPRKGTLVLTMLPELHLYLILYVPHYKTIHIWPHHNWNWNKILFKKLQLVNLCSLDTLLFSFRKQNCATSEWWQECDQGRLCETNSKSPLSTVTKGIIWEVSVTKDIFPAFSWPVQINIVTHQLCNWPEPIY